MRVTHLSLGDYRNYATAEVSLQTGLNLIVGRNGQGKTNLVEAIAYFARLSSHRVTGDTALIRAGQDAAVARMRVAVADRDVLLEVQINKGKPNRAQINRNSARPRDLTRWFSCVVFAPEDLSLVRGEPSIRRRFLDEAVVARNPAFAATLNDYDRVVKQRTALLKSARITSNRSAVDATLEVWNEQLIDLGVTIMLARRSLVRSLAGPLRSGYFSIVEHDHAPTMQLTESVGQCLADSHVSRETMHFEQNMSVLPGGEEVVPAPQPTGDSVDVSRETLIAEFRAALELMRRQEYERGVTLLGPHRDDVLFELNGLPVKGFASHGESWSFALALRMALATLLRDESVVGDPVIILDDVFAELDARRRAALMHQVSQFEQVLVTAAVEEDVPPGEWHRVYIEAGAVVGAGMGHDES